MKNETLEERANKLSDNKIYWQAYLDYLREQVILKSITEGTATQYKNKIIILLENFNYVDICQVNFVELRDYFRTTKNASATKKVTIAALKDFFGILQGDAGARISDEQIETLRKEILRERADEINNATPLTVEEVVEIRNKLFDANRYKLLFTFEMFYTYGFTLDQMETFVDHYFLDDNAIWLEKAKAYKKKRGKERIIKLTPFLIKLIGDHPDLIRSRVKGTLQSNLSEIGTLISRGKLTWHDINQTRIAYFPTCPDCLECYPNDADFWSLIEFENDPFHTGWLYCRDCAEKKLRSIENE